MPKRHRSSLMPERPAKSMKIAPLKIRRLSPAERNRGDEDTDCYVAIDVEAVSDEDDRSDQSEDGFDIDKNYDNENDEEVDKIDTSWIKEEPLDDEPSEEDSLDEELYVNTTQKQNGDEHTMKSKHEDEEDFDLTQKPIKTESEDNYITANTLEYMEENVKTEEENVRNDTDDFWEEDENDVAWVEDNALPKEQVAILPFQANMQKCAKCAILFKPGSLKLPTQLQKFCNKCKPNVSISCKVCGKHFEHHKLYKRHARDCSSNLYVCNICLERFPTQRRLLHHKCQVEIKDTMCFICPICCEGFDKSKQRNHHKGLHVTDKAIKCKHCRRLFTDFSSFHDHMDSHPGRLFICLVCHMTFDTHAAYFADQLKHKEENQNPIIPERPPDFVYLCKFCKHWYSEHECPHICFQKKDLITHDVTQVRKDAVPRALDLLVGDKSSQPVSFQLPPPKQILQRTLGRTYTLTVTNEKGLPPPPSQTNSLGQKEESNQIKIHVSPKQSRSSPNYILPSKKNTQPTGKLNELDSSYTCQLCHVSFSSPHDLGHHACLNHTSFEDENDEDEDDDDDIVHLPTRRYAPFIYRKIDFSVMMARSEPKLQPKPTTSNQEGSPKTSLGGSEPKLQSKPPRSAQEGSTKTSLDTSGKHKLQAHRCVLCLSIVRHNFESIRGKWSAKYLCPLCIKKAAEEKKCVFKCSKCGQNFPSWSRLHMHLPWHRENTGGVEGVFKEPRLSFQKLPPGQKENTTPEPQHSSGKGDIVSSTPDQTTKVNAAHPQQVMTPGSNVGPITSAASLSALLKEPVTLLKSGNSLAGASKHQNVKNLLKVKILEGKAPVQIKIAPKMSNASPQMPNQLVLNAPLIAPKSIVPEATADQSVSLMTQVHHGLFPPVVEKETKQHVTNSSENNGETHYSDNCHNEEMSTTSHTKDIFHEVTTNGSQNTTHIHEITPDDINNASEHLGSMNSGNDDNSSISNSCETNDKLSETPAPTYHRQGTQSSMDIEIITKGNSKIVQAVPKKQPPVQSIQPQDYLTISKSVQVTCGTSSVSTASTAVPLTYDGNALTKINPNGCVAIPASLVSGSSGLLPKIILPKLILPKSSSVIVASSSPDISSLKLSNSSSNYLTVQKSAPLVPLTGKLTSGSSINLTFQSNSPATVSNIKLTGSSNTNLPAQNNIPVSSGPLLVALPEQRKPPNEQTPRGVFFCYTCNLLFMDIASLKAHGCPIEAFSCHLCNKLFPSPEQLYNHECLKKSYTCHMCNKKCSSAKELNQHKCINTNNKATKQDTSMKQALEEKIGSECNADSAGSADNQEKQLRTMTSLEEKIGSECNADSAGSADNQEKQLRTMTWDDISKVNSYTCPACSLKFSSKASLYIHKMKHNMRV